MVHLDNCTSSLTQHKRMSAVHKSYQYAPRAIVPWEYHLRHFALRTRSPNNQNHSSAAGEAAASDLGCELLHRTPGWGSSRRQSLSQTTIDVSTAECDDPVRLLNLPFIDSNLRTGRHATRFRTDLSVSACSLAPEDQGQEKGLGETWYSYVACLCLHLHRAGD